jgi:hypothetical protein
LLWLAYAYQACGIVDARCMFDGLKDWQPIIAALIALISAIAAIIQFHIHRRSDRLQKAISYRTTLAFNLSEIMEWCEEEFKIINAQLGGASWAPVSKTMDLTNLIELIRLNIEYSDDNKNISRTLIALCHNLQIYIARRKGENFLSDPDMAVLAVDCAEIYALASELFAVSRGPEFQDIALQREGVELALQNLQPYRQDRHKDIHDAFNFRYPKSS